MAEYTAKINLTKPAYEEFADIAIINENMDKIDQAIANLVTNGELEQRVSNLENGKADKAINAKEGNLAVLTSIGGIADSGLKFAVNNGGLQITYDDGSEV